jgi:hypothetical protein
VHVCVCVAVDPAHMWSSQVLLPPLAIFCNQVFFDYDPSSSTSLLSSALGQSVLKQSDEGRDESRDDWGEDIETSGDLCV